MRIKNIVFGMLFIPVFLSPGHTKAGKNTVVRQTDKNGLTQTVAADIYRQFLSEHTVLHTADNPDLETVNRIGNRIIMAVKNYYAARKASKELEGFNWEISFIQFSKVDAWCLPGGKIAVYSALLPVTQSDASLAAVLAHEIAHVMLQHGDPRIKQYLKEFLHEKDLATAIGSKPKETKDFYRMAYGNGDYIGVIRGFDTKDEMQADELGCLFAALAGYNPTDAIVFWERMGRLNGTGRQPELLSTHPVDEKRLEHLKEIMDGILQYYGKPIKKN
ncbi:MAG: M48 family metallopeptidase [Bacteroidota bacterium]